MKTKIDLDNITGLSDTMFKAIMSTNEDILVKILNSIFSNNIKNIKYLNGELPISEFIEKGRRLDLYIEEDESIIDIEVTNNYNITMIDRNLGFLSKMYTSTVEKGDDYTLYKPTKTINLIGNKSNEKMKLICSYTDQFGDIISNKLIYCEIYIQNFIELWYNKNEDEINKYKYLIMLGLNKKELNRFNLEYGDEIVSEYTNAFNKILVDESFLPLFDKEEDERRIKNTIRKISFEDGKEDGKQQRNIEIAKNLLNNNVDIEIISKSTGLTIDEINNLM
mgnify:CR=1 FL=1